MNEAGRLACRIIARWSEGQVANDGFASEVLVSREAGTPPPMPPAEVVRVALERPAPDPELSAVLRAARERRLPSVYEPGGVAFPDGGAPCYVDHAGVEVGRWLVWRREGDRFTAQGWAHPFYADRLRACAGVSPGLWIVSAELAAFGEVSEVLHVGRSWLLELSATDAPARPGTSLSVGARQRVPDPDWGALDQPGRPWYFTGS